MAFNLVCEYQLCGKEFTAKSRTAKFCQRSCSNLNRSETNRIPNGPINAGKKSGDKSPVNPKNIRQQKFEDGIIAGKTQTQAAIDAGYSKKCAASTGSSLVRNPKIQRSLLQRLDEAGITESKILKKVFDGMDCQRVVSAIGGKDAGAATTDFIEVPDNPSQIKYTQIASEFRGLINPKESEESKKPELHIHFELQSAPGSQQEVKSEKYADAVPVSGGSVEFESD